ncbi:hypothetical protein ACQ4PT_048649 [Festuca glaucescens]
MAGLRAAHGGPPFEPHATVVGAVTLRRSAAIEALRAAAAAGVAPYTARVTGLARGDFFYQCVYLLRSSVDGKETDGSVPSTPSHSVLGDAMSLKESSDQSCSSSVIDDEGCMRRGPTVVARLMGLDSMAEASSSGPYPMPFSGQHALQNNAHDELIGRSYVGISSPHKMLSSPIDRFSMETLPPRFARRTLSVPQQKLFSPVKNPNHVSSRNAADIMEAASRIIGPGVENSSSYRVRDVGYSNDVRAFNPREIVRVQQMSQAAKKRDVSASSKPPSGKLSDASSKKCDPDK